MRELRQVQAVTENFFLWQGLRLIPIGLLFVLAALGFAEPAPWPYSVLPAEIVLLLALGVAMGLFKVAGRYYARTFGTVRGQPGRHEQRDRIKWWLVYPLMIGSLILDYSLQGPIFLSGLVWGLALFAFWASTGRGRPHYLVAAALLFFLAPLPALGWVRAGAPMLLLFHLLVGFIYIVGGLLDHLALLRLLPPVREEADARAI